MRYGVEERARWEWQDWNVVPSYDCSPVIDVDERTLRRLTAYEVVFGMSVVRDYSPLIDVTWTRRRSRRCREPVAGARGEGC